MTHTHDRETHRRYRQMETSIVARIIRPAYVAQGERSCSLADVGSVLYTAADGFNLHRQVTTIADRLVEARRQERARNDVYPAWWLLTDVIDVGIVHRIIEGDRVTHVSGHIVRITLEDGDRRRSTRWTSRNEVPMDPTDPWSSILVEYRARHYENAQAKRKISA